MYHSTLDSALPGSVLGMSLFDQAGNVLMRAGSALEIPDIDRLRAHGFARAVLVDDQSGPEDFVAPEHWSRVWSALAQSTEFLTDIAHDKRPPAAGAGKDIEARLSEALQPFLADICSRRRLTLPGPAPQRGPAAWFHGALHGAAVAVFLGKELDADEGTLQQLAHGTLLRDVGQLLLPEGLLDKPGALSLEEEALVCRHPQTGFDLLREADWGDGAVRMVVLQHHERPDGSGYPHGLSGLHTVRRLSGQRFNRDIVFWLSEIAAVADVFTALTTDRPYRPALPARRASLELESKSKPLSLEVVNLLLRSWAPYRDEASTIRSTSNDSLFTLMARFSPQRAA